MSVADKLGFGPKREVDKNDDGSYTITVTPPAWVSGDGGNSQQLVLSQDQFDRYQRWQSGTALIQDVLSDLTASQRELLMTGLTDDDFKEPEEEEDNQT